MDATTRQTLIEKMYEVIEEEGLKCPSKILIRQPSRGKQRSLGKAICSIITNDYHIVITITSPIYIRDDNGKYWDTKNKNERYKCDGWKEQSKSRIIQTVAHEIAHLKFWNHNTEHVGYELHLIEMLCNKLKGWNENSTL